MLPEMQVSWLVHNRFLAPLAISTGGGVFIDPCAGDVGLLKYRVVWENA
jgi:hypothetical protein